MKRQCDKEAPAQNPSDPERSAHGGVWTGVTCHYNKQCPHKSYQGSTYKHVIMEQYGAFLEFIKKNAYKETLPFRTH